jgi:type IV secretion system protein VirB11
MSDRPHERRHIEAQIAPLAQFLDEPGIYEIVVNRPGEVWIERPDGWQVHAVPEMTFDRLENLAKVIAAWSRQAIDTQHPILSATLPSNERVQIVLPPAVAPNTISMTLRKPSSSCYTLAELQRRDLFASVKRTRDTFKETDAILAAHLGASRTEDFLRVAVKARKNIIISGATGSGKTTLSKALIAEIPADERIITIEDTPELVVPHRNAVQLFYSKGGQGAAKVGPKELLEACLRMRPDRILLQELRDGTAFYYLRNVNSGHPGSITTVHADSATLAFEQLTLLVKESDGGNALDRADIRALLHLMVDIVVQTKRVGGQFRVTEIHFARRDREVVAAT